MRNHTKQLIKEWNTDNAHFEDICNKCDEIYESLEVKKENEAKAAWIAKHEAEEAVTAAEKQKK